MKQFAVTSVILIILHTVLSEANVQIKPIPVDNKNSGKNDLKPEEARYQNPIMPEYYQGNRQGFVTSNFMDNLGAYDRYGYNNLDNKFGSTYFDRYGSNSNKYGGLDYNNRERFGSSEFIKNYFKNCIKVDHIKDYGVNTSPLDTKFGTSFGRPGFPPTPTEGGAMFGPFGYPTGGILPPELEKKASVVLPLAGAALLGKYFLTF